MTEMPSRATSTSAQSESEIGFGRCGERVANVPRGWSSRKRVDRVRPADGFVQVRDHPDVGEAVEIGEAAAMGLREHDPRWAGVVRRGLQRHAVEGGVGRADMPDRLVVDRASPALVEERLDEGARRPRAREAPDGDGAVEARGLGNPHRKSGLAPGEEIELSAQQR